MAIRDNTGTDTDAYYGFKNNKGDVPVVEPVDDGVIEVSTDETGEKNAAEETTSEEELWKGPEKDEDKSIIFDTVYGALSFRFEEDDENIVGEAGDLGEWFPANWLFLQSFIKGDERTTPEEISGFLEELRGIHPGIKADGGFNQPAFQQICEFLEENIQFSWSVLDNQLEELFKAVKEGFLEDSSVNYYSLSGAICDNEYKRFTNVDLYVLEFFLAKMGKKLVKARVKELFRLLKKFHPGIGINAADLGSEAFKEVLLFLRCKTKKLVWGGEPYLKDYLTSETKEFLEKHGHYVEGEAPSEVDPSGEHRKIWIPLDQRALKKFDATMSTEEGYDREQVDELLGIFQEDVHDGVIIDGDLGKVYYGVVSWLEEHVVNDNVEATDETGDEDPIIDKGDTSGIAIAGEPVPDDVPDEVPEDPTDGTKKVIIHEIKIESEEDLKIVKSAVKKRLASAEAPAEEPTDSDEKTKLPVGGDCRV